MIAMRNHVLPIRGSSEPWPLLDSEGAVQAYPDTRGTDELQQSTGRQNTHVAGESSAYVTYDASIIQMISDQRSAKRSEPSRGCR